MTDMRPSPKAPFGRGLQASRAAVAIPPGVEHLPTARVLAAVVLVEDRYGWCLVDTEGEVLGQGCEKTRGQAEFAVIAAAMQHPALTGHRVYVGCSGPLKSAIELNRKLLPTIHTCPGTPQKWPDAHRRVRLAAEAAACPTGPLVVASDGSVSKRRKGIGWGWVASDGTHSHGSLDAGSIGHAEVAGIVRAVRGTRHRSEVLVLSDSKEAISIVRAALAGATGTGTGALAVLMDTLREAAQGRVVRVEWVKGHAGHALNEGADRLAVLANRVSRGLVPANPTVAARIATEAAAEYRAQVENSSKFVA